VIGAVVLVCKTCGHDMTRAIGELLEAVDETQTVVQCECGGKLTLRWGLRTADVETVGDCQQLIEWGLVELTSGSGH